MRPPARARNKKRTETQPRATSALNDGDAASAYAPPPSLSTAASPPPGTHRRGSGTPSQKRTETQPRATSALNVGDAASAYAPPPSLSTAASPPPGTHRRGSGTPPRRRFRTRPPPCPQKKTETWPRATSAPNNGDAASAHAPLPSPSTTTATTQPRLGVRAPAFPSRRRPLPCPERGGEGSGPRPAPVECARRRDGAKRQTTFPFRFRPLPSWAVVSGRRALVRDLGCSGRGRAKKQGVSPFSSSVLPRPRHRRGLPRS